MFNLQIDHRPYTDKYFLRSNEILKADNLNPFVRMQVFVRKSNNNQIHGLNEALEILQKYSKLTDARIYSLSEGDNYAPKETCMIIEAKIQDIIELETMYLGVISRETTLHASCNYLHAINSDIQQAHYDEHKKYVEKHILDNTFQTFSEIRELIGKDRKLIYMGARHWGWELDAEIAKAAFDGGADDCSTDIGAADENKLGVGTIPHALENIYAWKYGMENAVVNSTLAFDKHIDKSVPRIALIDYNNHEYSDSLDTAKCLDKVGSNLDYVRVDTCGENFMQGILYDNGFLPFDDVNDYNKFYLCKGVAAIGVHRLRNTLNFSGFPHVKILLSSGFGNIEKVKAFLEYEKLCQEFWGEDWKLFDGIGCGECSWDEHMRMAGADVVAVGDTIDTMTEVHKVGRGPRPNSNLKRVL